jgi:hypothetical protein
MDGWMDGWMGGQVGGWTGGQVDGWVGVCVCGWMGGWMDGWNKCWLKRHVDSALALSRAQVESIPTDQEFSTHGYQSLIIFSTLPFPCASVVDT